MAKPIKITILGDASHLERTVAGVHRTVGGIVGTVAKVGGAVAGAFAVGKVVEFGKASVDAASDLNESLSKATVVFGAQADAIERWADGAARGFGMSKQQALEAAGTFGNLFRAMEIGTPKAADMSKGLIQLASDLASFNNADPTEVLEALRSGLVGETEPLRRFGVNLSAARIEAEALRMGLAKKKDELTAGAKAQAAYNLILNDTKLAQGDFARTSDGLANRQRILAAQWKDMQAKVGGFLLPAVVKVSGAFVDLASTLGTRLRPAFDAVRLGVSVFAKAFQDPDITSDGWVGQVERIASAVRHGFDSARLAVSVFAKAFQDPDITSDGWVGQVERIASAVRGAFDIARQAVASFLGNFREGTATAERLGEIADGVKQVWASMLGAVVPVVETVVKVVTDLWDRFGSHLIDHLRIALNAVLQIVSGALAVLSGVFDLVKAVLTGKWGEAWDAVKKILSGALDIVVGLIRLAVNQVSTIIGAGMAAISAVWSLAWNSAKTLLTDVFGHIKDFLVRFWPELLAPFTGGLSLLVNAVADNADKIVGFFKALPGRILDVVGSIRSAAASVGGSVIDGLASGLDRAAGIAGDIAGAVTSALKSAVNRVIDLLNAGIPDSLGWGPLSIDIPDNPIPHLRAMGGPAQGRVRVGERGPEDVLLPRGSKVVPNHALAHDGGVHVHVQTNADPWQIGDAVAWQLRTG